LDFLVSNFDTLGLGRGGARRFAAAADEGLSETVARYFCAYEPTYLILGAVEKGRTNPTTKFAFSFQTMLLDFSKPDDDVLDSCAEPSGRHLVHFGYTQKSIGYRKNKRAFRHRR
jgi:hypothetical protein